MTLNGRSPKELQKERTDSINNVAGFIFLTVVVALFFTSVFMFWGEPDIHDALIMYLMRCG